MYDEVRRISESRPSAEWKSTPQMTPADVLLAVARQTGLDLAAKLLNSGLDIELLEQETKVTRPPKTGPDEM